MINAGVMVLILDGNTEHVVHALRKIFFFWIKRPD